MSHQTPRTNAQVHQLSEPLTGWASYPDTAAVVPADFARELERESADRLALLLAAELREKRLREALDRIVRWNGNCVDNGSSIGAPNPREIAEAALVS